MLVRSACVAAVGAAVLGAAATSGLGAAPLRCKSSQLRLKFVSFQSAIGHRYWQMAFRNAGSTCSLRGFSRVELLAADGHVITSPFHHETAFPVKTVVVGHGRRAFVAYTYLDGGFCNTGQFNAPRARLFPPGAVGGFVFNMVPKNLGPPYVCPGTGGVFPVTARPGP